MENFEKYEAKFKALGDKQRLQIIFEICKRGKVCVCDLCDIVNMPQSKLSYHLKVLHDSGLLSKSSNGTWNFYEVNQDEVSEVLSESVCKIFKEAGPTEDCGCK